jgi:hypothetical protein
MSINVIVWDIETVPDLKGFAAANGNVGKPDDEIRAATRSSPCPTPRFLNVRFSREYMRPCFAVNKKIPKL